MDLWMKISEESLGLDPLCDLTRDRSGATQQHCQLEWLVCNRSSPMEIFLHHFVAI